MKFQIERNREIYREALPGIPMLAWRGRLAVKVSYMLYRAILAEIERARLQRLSRPRPDESQAEGLAVGEGVGWGL